MGGLDISINEFKRLPSRQQMCLLYENTQHIRGCLTGYQFHKKLQYVWLAALTVAIAGKDYLIAIIK